MKTIINTENAPSPVGPYNQSVRTGDILFISGQIAIDPQTNDLVTDDIQAETRQVMENIKAILAEAGLSMKDVVKCSVFVSDMHQYGHINSVYSEYFSSDEAPARELVEVANLPKFVNIEISAVACFSDKG